MEKVVARKYRKLMALLTSRMEKLSLCAVVGNAVNLKMEA